MSDKISGWIKKVTKEKVGKKPKKAIKHKKGGDMKPS